MGCGLQQETVCIKDKFLILLHLLVIPVLRMIEDCKMSCGADSRNASDKPIRRADRFIFVTSAEFSGGFGDIRTSPKSVRIFLKIQKDDKKKFDCSLCQNSQ